MIGLSSSTRICYALSVRLPVRLCAVPFFAIAAICVAGDSRSLPKPQPESFHEFEFIRLIYTTNPYGVSRGNWLTDWPDAEANLLQGVRRLSRIDIAPEGGRVAIMDDSLFDHPWIYAVEVGGLMFNDEEAKRMREYFDRGGFLMVDDFHGTVEWRGFEQAMRKVFPDRPIVEIPVTHPIFKLQFDLDNSIQIPGMAALVRGVTYERDGDVPHWRGIFDDKGRLMVVIDFNMDLGDAWELADRPDYDIRYTTRAYKFAINYILYSMTH